MSNRCPGTTPLPGLAQRRQTPIGRGQRGRMAPPGSTAFPRRAKPSLCCLRGFGGNSNTCLYGDVQTPLIIFKESQGLQGGVAGEWRGSGFMPPPPRQGSLSAHSGAYLGHGSGEEPAGRWRGAACCQRARRGWGCSGHFHCLQTEEHRAERRGKGKAEYFKHESYSQGAHLPAWGSPPAPLPREGTVASTDFSN